MSGRTTPSQTVGPFFSIGFAWLDRVDLTEGAKDQQAIKIRGRVLDGDGQPVPDAVLEIWQANSGGRYGHPEDAADLVATEPFWGFGRVPVNDAGEFCFSTIKPGGVAGPGETRQAPHLAVSVFMRGLLKRLVTRIYFPGEPLNDADSVLARVPVARRQTLIARTEDSQGKTLVWDVHLQGAKETVFFDC
ncbi:MAG TPA: protocatechuate 3,4-dioxygenase subunit alpha [Candidatus Sulfotelmatobacter sp.]|nr:protocatechuate 3,4-dioxygenase subunit alpha [Candidatus Sulfotelmatobacter sp.]